MIQDISPHCYHNEYRPAEPEDDSVVLIYREKEVLVRKDGQISYPLWGQVTDAAGEQKDYTYLFSIDKTAFYLLSEEAGNRAGELLLEKGFAYRNIQIFRSEEPGFLAFAGITGYQLFRWYQSRKFCGRCGRPMQHDEKERMMRCPDCGLMEYPKICPAVIVAVTDQDRLLLTRYAGREYTRHALIAGFAEVGESIEDTVRREVMEETGLKVDHIRYYKSQPWSFTDTLLLGFVCDLAGSDEVILDEDELSEGVWFQREEIPADGTDISLTREMMWKFKNREL